MMTKDQADCALLMLANEKGKFALELGYTPALVMQEAFERGIDHQWFTLVDIGPLAAYPTKVFRVFRLTDAGRARLEELR